MLRHGERVDLCGSWDFLPGSLKAENCLEHVRPGSSLEWGSVEVPYCWNGSRWMSIVGSPYASQGYYKDGRPPPYGEHRGVGWYRTTFVVPPGWQGSRVHVRFLGVAARARVWLNGCAVGEHLGAYGAFSIDLTAALSAGPANHLVVQVWGKSCFYPDDERRFDQGGIHLFVPGRTVEIPVGESRDNAGIYQPVELFATGPAYIEDAEVEPEAPEVEGHGPCTGRLRVRVHLVRASQLRMPVDVRLRLVELSSGRTVREETKRTHLPEERMPLSFPWTSLEIRSWSPEDPALYRLELTLAHADEVWQRVELRIGFKSFVIRDGGFLLNGRPCFLRGAGTPPHPLIVNDADYIRRFLRHCKEANLNCIRFHTEPPSQAWLDGCDEAGLLVIYEFPLMQQAPEVVNTRREIRELVRQARHHPSLAVYCLSNETDFLVDMAAMSGYPSMEAYLADLREAVLQEDSSLPVYHDAGYTFGEGGDIRDWHIYGGWYDNSIYAFEAIVRGKAMMEALSPREGKEMVPGGLRDKRNARYGSDKHKPVILSEFVAAYTDDDGHLFQYPLKVRRIGRYPDPDNTRSLWFQGFLLRECVEILRRARDRENRLCGPMPFALFNWFFHPLEPERMAPKPALRALREAMEPLHLSIRCWSRHRFCTDPLCCELYLIHDDASRAAVETGEVAYRIVSADGQTILGGKLDAGGVAYYEVKRLPLRISLPEIAADRITSFRLEAEWRSGGSALSRSSMDLLLAPESLRAPFRGDPREADGAAAIALIDGGGRTASVLERMGVRHQRIEGPPHDDGDLRLVIVGTDTLARLDSGATRRLSGMARSGITVLVLEQDVYDVNRPGISIDWIEGTPLRIMREDDQVDDFISITDLRSPIFRGLEAEHFRMWNGNTVIVSSYLRQGDESNHRPAKTRFGARSGYGVRKLGHVRTYAECYNFLRNDALLEVPVGRGRVIFSQIEATRRYGDDPVATVYLKNLLRHCSSAKG